MSKIQLNRTQFDSAIMSSATYEPNWAYISPDIKVDGVPVCSVTISVQGEKDCKKMMKLIQKYSFVSTEIKF